MFFRVNINLLNTAYTKMEVERRLRPEIEVVDELEGVKIIKPKVSNLPQKCTNKKFLHYLLKKA